MSGPGQGSVTCWIDALKAGDDAAAQPLWERYFAQLVRLARTRLATSRSSPVADAEDAALSAFNSFCDGARKGRFPTVIDRDGLWPLLIRIAARKVTKQIRYSKAAKRGGNKVICEADLAVRDDARLGDLVEAVGSEPTPEFAAMVAEEFRQLLDALPNEGLRLVAVWWMEGYTVAQTAERLHRTSRTVNRLRDEIRLTWREFGSGDVASVSPIGI